MTTNNWLDQAIIKLAPTPEELARKELLAKINAASDKRKLRLKTQRYHAIKGKGVIFINKPEAYEYLKEYAAGTTNEEWLTASGYGVTFTPAEFAEALANIQRITKAIWADCIAEINALTKVVK